MKYIGKIIAICKPLYPLLFTIAILILVTALIELVAPILSKYIVDEIVAQVNNKGGRINTLSFLIAVAFLMNLLGTILRVATNRLGDHLAGKMKKFLTETFYYKVLTLPQAYFDSEISGKITNQLSRGITTIYSFVNTATNFILPTFLQSIFTIVIMIYYDVWIGLLTFLLFPVYLILSHYSTKKWGEEEGKKNAIEDYYRGRLQEVISNIKLVKSFSTEQHEYDIVSKKLKESNEIYSRQSYSFHVYDFFRNLSLLLIVLGINILVFRNTFLALLTIGEMVLILQLLSQAQRPLFAMSYILTEIQMAEKGSKDFFEILSLPSVEHFNNNTKAERIESPTIEFKNVEFNYEKSDRILKDISFKINSKETVALVGHSGAGKSTTVNLILKFYNPTSGDVYLKDRKYSDLDVAFIRQNISLVFQENELFSSTIRENVSYGTVATDEEIKKALKQANAYDFVMELPHKLDSEVGERGVRLSGGQKQRIQVARAILKNAPILILDEATSSLDAKSEKEVQDALETLMKDRLVIIIAHRFSTIQNVDKVIVINKGTIVDYGSPQDLSKKDGIYSELLHYQIEGNKKLLKEYELY